MKKIEEVPHFRSEFRQCDMHRNEARKIELVEQIRDIALEYLPPAVIAKVPPPYFSDEARAAYAAKGISLEWNLSIRGDTGIDVFCFVAARDAGLIPGQQSAARLLSYCTEALDNNAVTERLQQWILDAYAELDLDAVEKGEKFAPRRKKGALSQKTKYIYTLASNHHELSAKELYAKADKKIIGNMNDGTFANHVSAARKSKA